MTNWWTYQDTILTIKSRVRGNYWRDSKTPWVLDYNLGFLQPVWTTRRYRTLYLSCYRLRPRTEYKATTYLWDELDFGTIGEHRGRKKHTIQLFPKGKDTLWVV